MIFSSILFLCFFFTLFFLSYYLVTALSRAYAKQKNLDVVPTWPRNTVLFLFSLLFYACGEMKYLWLLILSVLLNYAAALFIDAYKKKGRTGLSRFGLAISLVFNLGSLFFYKYIPLVFSSLPFLDSWFPGAVLPTLPFGISFFTFQIMSYVIDVYRQKVSAQKNLLIVGTYLCAFPQLIAGPIVRYADVEQQLLDRTETAEEIEQGLKRFIMGLSKKVLIANTMAMVADGIYAYSPESYGFFGAWIAAFAYAVQIYFDFSGYSDMAIGMGRMMGFTYLENFDMPYTAVTVKDFWRRWHMSLSGFFRDYVYIPIGGNRVSTPRWIFNMMVVWTLTGFWHGAEWNFVLWGVYYGILLILETKLFPNFFHKHRGLGHVYTILAFTLGWVIFRVEGIEKIPKAFGALIGVYGLGSTEPGIGTILTRSEAGGFFYILLIVGVICAMVPPVIRFMRKTFLSVSLLDGTVSKKREILSDVVCFIFLILSIALLESGSYNPFIYFRF